MSPMVILWAAALVIFLILEAISAAMTSIWFALGSLAALIATLLKSPLWLQILLFAAVSALCFAFLYPRLKAMLRKHGQATNTDALLGRECTVTEDIDNLSERGCVYIDGKTWLARSASGAPVAAGQIVRVQSIQGVKLIVSDPSEIQSQS